MAFIRKYSEQGDPFTFATMRAGQLQRRHVQLPAHLFPHGRKSRVKLAQLRGRGIPAAGDPFSFRLPKFVRKLSVKKIASAVGKVAKIALPIAAPFIPGIGPLLAPLVGGAFAGGGTPDSPAPELVQQPEYVGTVGEARRAPVFEEPVEEYESPTYRQQEYGSEDDEYADEDADEYADEED